MISGGLVGVDMGGNFFGSLNTVTNAGVITGGDFSVRFLNGNINVLTLLTGSVLNGTAQGNGANTSLVLQGTGSANNDFVAFNSLSVQASGTWALNGNSDIGTTTVSSGTLVIGDATHQAANLTGSVTVNSGAALAGQGAVGGDVTVASGGTIAPGSAGNPTGMLSVTGNLAFQSGAIYMVSLNGTAASNTMVGGVATLGGASVQIAQGSTIRAGTSYSILHADGGLSGDVQSPSQFRRHCRHSNRRSERRLFDLHAEHDC